MTSAMWLAVMSALLTANGALFTISYRDISRRLERLEHQDSKLNAAVISMMVAKPGDNDALARALHSLLTNGIPLAE